MRTFIACMSLILVMASIGCSRELRPGGDAPQRPFNFSHIPEGGEQAPITDGTQQSGVAPDVPDGETNPDGTPIEAVDPALEALISEGRNAMTGGDWEKAIEIYLEVVARDENNMIGLYNLGYSYRRSGNYDKAVEYSARAAQADPDKLYVHQNLGYAYLGIGDTESAMAEFEDELDRHPDVADLAGVAYQLAKLKLDNGLGEEAFDAAMHAVRLAPDEPDYEALLGEVHMANGAYDQALTSFRRASELGPDDGLYRKLAGDALWELGRKDEARNSYMDAINLDASLRDQIPAERLADDSETEESADSPM